MPTTLPTPLPMRAPAPPRDPAAQLFLDSGCGGCHTLDGVAGATGIAGPNLTNVALRPTLAGNSVPKSQPTMVRWLLDPAAVKPGATMPRVGLTQQQAEQIAAFLFAQPNAR